MTYGRGVTAYTQTQVSTSTSQKQLIVMAYDGILRFINRAKESMAKKEIEATHDDLVRSRAIVEELASTLNMEEGGQIAANLRNLYVFFMQKITEANLTKRPEPVDEILPLVEELRDAWSRLEVPEDDARAQALNRRVAGEDAPRLCVTG